MTGNMGVSIKVLHVTFEMWGCVFCMVMGLCLYISRNFEKDKRRLLIHIEMTAAALLGMDAFAWIYRGSQSEVGFWMVRISNFLVFICSDLIVLLYHAYVFSYLKKTEDSKLKFPKMREKLVYAIGILAMLLVIVSQFTNLYYYFDEFNFYHRSLLHPLSMLIPMTGMLIDMSVLIQFRRVYRKEVFFSLLSYIILPAIGCAILIFYYGISLVNIGICISAVFIFIVAVMEQNNILEENAKEVYDLRIQIMLSQIKPHFIYNTLTTIKYLCRKDPKQAAETVDNFAAYLRGNLDSLTAERMIPFEKELEHVQNYLAIEKQRFGKKIQVKYNIQERDFLVPALVMQPLIENAVKHGITKKVEGGTIEISVWKESSGFYITIEDDGLGYNANTDKKDGKSHIGVINTENRIKAMCGGKLYISSRPGWGTKAVIHIPGNSSVNSGPKIKRQERQNEYFSSR